MIRYPFLDLKRSTAPYIDELQAAAIRVVASGRYVGGPECEAFERELLEAHGATEGFYAIGCSNGLDAIRLILRGYIELGLLAPGDEVIVPANTYIASILPITEMGLTPVLVEPSVDTSNLDTSLLEQAVTAKTRAIMVVHLYGRPCFDSNLAEIVKRHNLLLIEDNAQAIGAESTIPGLNGLRKTGTLGHAAAFSFYPTKNIGALGDAGAVITPDSELAGTVRALANYGSDRRYHNIYCGYNCRLDPIQAATLRVLLPHLPEISSHRRELANIYERSITNQRVVKPLIQPGCVWHQYVVHVDDRDRFREELAKAGVGTDIHYAVPPHLQPCYASTLGSLSLPVTEKLVNSCVSLPISGATSTSDAGAIAEIINGLQC